MLLSMDDQQRFTFTKKERVTGDRRIEALFTRGRSFMAYPFRVVFLEYDQPFPVPVSIVVSIPKKRIRSAVKRNRVKRQVREAYRLNKHRMEGPMSQIDRHVDIAFVYVKDEVPDYSLVEKGIRKALLTLNEQLGSGKELL